MYGRAFLRGLILLLAATFPAKATAAETSLTLDSGTGMLAGTLLTPDHAEAAILILAGSGPTDRDRDGNSILGVRASSYRLLAEGLAAHGIASLRVDKRGVGESRAAMTREADLRINTYVDDAKAWAAELRRKTSLRCIWFLGHSEGALIAEMATQDTGSICGLILVSGIGHTLGGDLRAQMKILPPDLRKKSMQIIASPEHGQTVADAPPQLAGPYHASVQPYLISEISLDPAALLAKIKQPVLIIQGDNDIQVSVEDAKLLAAAKPDAKLMILPGVNHVLKAAPAARPANLLTYTDPDLPLAPGIVDAVANFVHEHGR
jgi:uncharacterized protein